MENQQAMTSEEQLQQQMLDKKAVDETDKLILARYMAGMQVAHKLMTQEPRMSARGIQRALFSAIDFGVTDSKIKFQNKREAELAGLLANVIEVSMLIKANNFKKREEENGKNNEETVVAGTRDTTQE